MKRPPAGTELSKVFAVDFGASWRRWAKNRTDSELEEINQRLSLLVIAFGKPHVHTGLGLRHLRGKVFEFRLSGGLRVVFLLFKPNRLQLMMCGNHDQVRAWLKENV